MNSSKKITEQTPPPAYFGSLTITDVKCFKGEHTIDLSDGNGKPAMWTVILGNNNTGKTTLLRCLANLEPELLSFVNGKYLCPKGYRRDTRLTNYSVSSALSYDGAECDFDWKYANPSEGVTAAYSYKEPKFSALHDLIIYGYGTSRKMGNSLDETENPDNTISLFDSSVILTNVEEWLLKLDHVIKSNSNENATKSARSMLQKILKVITSGLLPGVNNFSFVTDFTNGRAKNFVTAQMDYGDIPLRELGEGY